MGFDTQGFMRASWAHRTQEVAVPEIAEYFTDGAKPVFIVRSLSADELYKIRSASSRQKTLEGIAEGLAEGSKSGAAKAIKEALGASGALDPATPRAMETLIAGCVDPPCDLDMARLLMDKHGLIFMKLSDTIMTLTGQGGEVEKKAAPSGKTTASARR